ncbi:hypothetical protein FGU65_10430 [Methanoculleus sp. FWC-SCC1]|uniref:Cohesin domain-containing protein n=1 Tax=Methanoculleus frigidifontis TaxID=2584085 RepID=A0ABT8MBJ5_9EURY|nr:hypothetical protein [Methanoculleus sp. FWC-SCC1]MDN7025303.1 hypothetical protein [Methanoculleus sp. FWC-SCC1]
MTTLLRATLYSLIAFLLVGVSAVSGLTVTAGTVQIPNVGETTTLSIILDEAPNGLSGSNVSVSLDDPSIAEFIDVTYPDWMTLSASNSFPSDTVFIKGVDLHDKAMPGATSISLGTVTVRGDAVGVSAVAVSIEQIDDDFGAVVDPTSVSGSVTVDSAQQMDLPLKTGWNLVSIPFSNAEYTVPSGSILAIYGYDPATKAYESAQIQSLVPGKAYWIASAYDCTVIVTGTPVSPVTVELAQGWNLIGSTAVPIAFSDIAIDPAGSWAMQSVYGYSTATQGYVMTTELQSGGGYWGAVIRDCIITLP